MIMLIQTAIAIGIIVVLAEYLWRSGSIHGESARKFVHIIVGTFVSFWGFYLSDNQILLLALSMFVVVLVSRYLNLFRAIHNVTRKTWGELFFPLGIAVTAAMTSSPWVFMAALLHVSLADGLAAVVGSKYIRKHGYKAFGQQKTVVGTLTFVNASIFITLATMLATTDLHVSLVVVFLIPILTAAIENLSRYGADDLLVPITVVLLLSTAL